jgi:hypothetical protein
MTFFADTRRVPWRARFVAVLASLLGILLVSPAVAHAAVQTLIINTIPAWNGSAYVQPFGEPATATYGQTITPTSDTFRLQSFTFVVKLDADVKFRGYVYQWDPVAQRATGVARWSSLTRHTTGYTWQRVTLNTGGLRLALGKKYVVFLSVSGLRQEPAEHAGLFAQPQNRDLYRAGAFVFTNNSSVSDWTTRPWDGGTGDYLGVGGDLAFKAVLTS